MGEGAVEPHVTPSQSCEYPYVNCIHTASPSPHREGAALMRSFQSKTTTKVTKMLLYLVVVWEGISEFVAGCWDGRKQFTPYVISEKKRKSVEGCERIADG